MRFRFLFCCLLLPVLCAAVLPYTPKIADPILEPWRWREVPELERLGAFCMDEASDGTFWFGVIGGIASYDGVSVTQVPFDDSLLSRIAHDIPHPRARALVVMRDGNLLLIAGRSLIRRVGEHWDVILQDIGSSSFEAQLKQAKDGSVWLMTQQGVWYFSEDLSAYREVIQMAENRKLTAFCMDAQNSVWVVQSTPLKKADLVHISVRGNLPTTEAEWGRYRIPVEVPGAYAGITAGLDGRIWYADNNAGNGILAFNPVLKNWVPLRSALSRKGYFSLTTIRNGTVWAGGHGLFYAVRPDGEGFYSRDKLGLPAAPLTMFESSGRYWWIIGRVGHVYFLDRSYEQWKTYLDLHYQCETADGIQWFLTIDARAVSYDPSTGKWLKYGPEDQMIGRPRTLSISSHGLIWAAGRHADRAAVSVFDGKSWTRHLFPEFAMDTGWGSLSETADGTVWFGAQGELLNDPPGAGGALQFEVSQNGTVRLLKHHAPPDYPYYVKQLVQTPDGVLWLGSPTVQRCEDTLLSKANPVHDLPVTATFDMVLDREGALWVAKEASGVYCRKDDVWWRYTKEDGLASDQVYDLLALQDGTLLAASDQGISRFDGINWSGYQFSSDFAMANKGGNMRQDPSGAIWLNLTQLDSTSPQVVLNTPKRFRTVRYRADIQPPGTEIKEYLKRVAQPGNVHISWSGKDPFSRTEKDQLQYSWRFDEGEWSSFSSETGKTFLDLKSGPHFFEVRSRDADFNIDPTPARIEFSVTPPIWSQVWFVTMVISFLIFIVMLVWIIVRIRERHLVERQIEREKHLLEMDQLKTGFYTNISHELNTPLGLIKGPLERMLETVSNEDSEHLLSMAMRNVDRMANLVSQLLDFRKLEQGQIRMEVVEGDISKYVRESTELLQPLAKKKQVSFVVESSDSCFGWFDPDKLKKIISNLVVNAFKYTDDGGRVRIVLKSFESGDGKMLSMAVEDTGSGVGLEHLKRIFDRFYRIPEKSIVDGSGIGLNLTKELVDLWGGTIRAESPIHTDPKHPGTRFIVILPIDIQKISKHGATNGKPK